MTQNSKDFFADIDAFVKFTNDIDQWQILQRLDESIWMNKINVNLIIFIFEIKSISSIKTISLNTSIEIIIFHIISIHISFLLCLVDMNKLNVYFNNIINQMIQNQQIHLVVRRYDHVFLLWHIFAYHVVVEFFVSDLCFLIEIELRRFHRRFDHFSICRLYQILQQTQQKIDL